LNPRRTLAATRELKKAPGDNFVEHGGVATLQPRSSNHRRCVTDHVERLADLRVGHVNATHADAFVEGIK
jgi:hypothetical protein